MITILNTSIITAHGAYCYSPCSLEQARSMVKSQGHQSAIGHESTAAVISTLLGVEVKMNRIQYQQQPKEVALVFKLKSRAPEGKILTTEEIEEIGYEWGLLERVDVSNPAPESSMVSADNKAKTMLLPTLRLLEKTMFTIIGILAYFGVLCSLWMVTVSAAGQAGGYGGLVILATVVAGVFIVGLRYLIDRIHYSDCV